MDGQATDWSVIHAQIALFFADRMPEYHPPLPHIKDKQAAAPPLTFVRVSVMFKKRRHRIVPLPPIIFCPVCFIVRSLHRIWDYHNRRTESPALR